MICRKFDTFDAMVFNNCNCVHTMLMSMNIDIIFIDSENRVCDLREKLVPWRPWVRCGKASTVIELPEGAIRRSGTAVGDVLDLNAETSKDTAAELAETLMPTPGTAMAPLEGQTGR